MPVVAIAAVLGFVVSVFAYWGSNNHGVEFFVETEPEQAIVYVRARGNLSLEEKDALLRQAEEIVLADPGVSSAFAFAGAGGLNSDGGGGGPLDTVGQIQIETIPWEERPAYVASGATDLTLEQLDGDAVLARLDARLATIPGIETEVGELAMGPGSGKPVHLRLMGDDLDTLAEAAAIVRARMEATPGLVDVEDTPAAARHRLAHRRGRGEGRPLRRRRADRGRHGPARHPRARARPDARGQLRRGDRHHRAPARGRPASVHPRHAQGPHHGWPRAAVELHHPHAGGQARPDQPHRSGALLRRQGRHHGGPDHRR